MKDSVGFCFRCIQAIQAEKLHCSRTSVIVLFLVNGASCEKIIHCVCHIHNNKAASSLENYYKYQYMHASHFPWL